MRDWQKYWSNIKQLETTTLFNARYQVGKTVLGKPVSDNQMELITVKIIASLQLSIDDIAVDLGCGNGIVTTRIAKNAKQLYGYDFSPTLIDSAKRFYPGTNLCYDIGNICHKEIYSQLPDGITKFYSYEVLQHLSEKDVKDLLSSMKQYARKGFHFFAGSIPDLACIKKFYNTKERWMYYQKSISEGTEQIGHWWGRQEITDIATALGLRCRILEQDSSLYTAHYRFDVVIDYAI